MSSSSRSFAAALALLTATGAVQARELRVCADPNNLPFSNQQGEGFENRIAAIVADELHAELTYTWWAQRRGFIRNTLGARLCDLVPGTVAGLETVRSTRPYYRSSYVFVSRADRKLDIGSFDDPALRTLTIGVQLVGDSGSNPPPANALARRGMTQNVRGYLVTGDYAQPNPPADIVRAVVEDEVDLAIVWGPLAGYFARTSPVALTIAAVEPQVDGPVSPMVFDIAMGVRWADAAFRDEIDRALADRRADIDRILADYGVPRLDSVRSTP